MKTINRNNIKATKFVGFIIPNMTSDKDSKSLRIELSKRVGQSARKWIEEESGYIDINQYDAIHVTSYNLRSKTTQTLSEDDYEQLGEISELDISDNQLVIRGFSKKTFYWLEFVITGGRVNGQISKNLECC